MKPLITVFGSSRIAPDSAAYAEALRLGTALAQAGAHVACGGYGGVMEAVARGAHETGGRAVGFTLPAIAGRQPNEFLSEVRDSPTLYGRLEHLIRDADAMIALTGGIGTVAEVLVAWNELALQTISPRPVIVVGSAWSATLEGLAEFLEVGPKELAMIDVCANVDDAIQVLIERGILPPVQPGQPT